MSLAELTIPIRNLRNLPEGAVYTSKSGQATASATMKGDTIYIYAQCDSLQQLVWQREEELTRIRDQLEQYQAQSQPAESPFKWYLYGVLTGIIITGITLLFIKKKRK